MGVCQKQHGGVGGEKGYVLRISLEVMRAASTSCLLT